MRPDQPPHERRGARDPRILGAHDTSCRPARRGERVARHPALIRARVPSPRARRHHTVVIPIHGLFETHLNVRSLDASIRFYRDTLGLQLASTVEARRAAFFWIGAPGQAMLGLWETGPSPLQLHGHFAFKVTLADALLAAPALRKAGIEPLDFDGAPTSEAVVLAWMPAAAVYFRDPDGHLLEFLAMLDERPEPELGVLAWPAWMTRGRGRASGRRTVEPG